MNRRLIKGNKGFTLIELLVVITILGLLVGLTAPAMVEYVSSSKIDKCVSERDGLAAGFKSLLGDYSVDDAWTIWVKDVSTTKCDNEFYTAELAADKKSFTITCPKGHGESKYTIDNEETIAAPEISTGVTEPAKPTETTSKVSIGEPEASTEATTTVAETTEPISTTIVETSTPASISYAGESWNEIIIELDQQIKNNVSYPYRHLTPLTIYYDDIGYFYNCNTGPGNSVNENDLKSTQAYIDGKIPTLDEYIGSPTLNTLRLTKKIYASDKYNKVSKGDICWSTDESAPEKKALYVWLGDSLPPQKPQQGTGQWSKIDTSGDKIKYSELISAGFTEVS